MSNGEMRPDVTPFLYFTTAKSDDSVEVNDYRTNLAQAQLLMSGVDSWTETGRDVMLGHVTFILVSGDHTMPLTRVAEVAHMYNTTFYRISDKGSAYLENPRAGTSLHIGWLKLVEPAQLNDMLLSGAPYLRVSAPEGSEFYVIGS